jgi:hypothetical protein
VYQGFGRLDLTRILPLHGAEAASSFLLYVDQSSMAQLQ